MVNSTLNMLRLDMAMSYGKSKSTSEDEQYIDITTTHNVLSLCIHAASFEDYRVHLK